ncbi:MAG: hypothetical protein ACRD3S_13705 [Terracidiphilus sp.]
MSQLAVLEKHVHRFPKRVVENLDEFLMDEGVLRCGRKGIGALLAWQRKRHGVLRTSRFQSIPDFRITFRGPESHCNVVRAQDGIEPRPKEDGKIQGWKRPFTDYDGMNKLD